MDIFKVRGHHVRNLVGLLDHLPPDDFYESMAKKYSVEYAKTWKEFDKTITKDTMIEIVEGLDDICKMGCPHQKWCGPKDYDSLNEFFMSFYNTEIQEAYKGKNLHDADEDDAYCLDKYLLKVGDIWRVGSIKEPGKITRPFYKTYNYILRALRT